MDLRISVYFHQVVPIRFKIKRYILSMSITACIYWFEHLYTTLITCTVNSLHRLAPRLFTLYISDTYSVYKKINETGRKLISISLKRIVLVWKHQTPLRYGCVKKKQSYAPRTIKITISVCMVKSFFSSCLILVLINLQHNAALVRT